MQNYVEIGNLEQKGSVKGLRCKFTCEYGKEEVYRVTWGEVLGKGFREQGIFEVIIKIDLVLLGMGEGEWGQIYQQRKDVDFIEQG